MLLPAFSGNGIISEAINEVMNYGFNEMHLHSVKQLLTRITRFSEGFTKKRIHKRSSLKGE
jgi:ribosomal-protein-alanine N-acetyltransferase